MLDIRCHAERDVFGYSELPPFLETYVVIDVDHLNDMVITIIIIFRSLDGRRKRRRG